MRRWALLLCALGMVLGLGSCRRADEPAATSGAQAKAAADEELNKFMKSTGETLDTITLKLERLRALEEAQAKSPPLERDLQVARLLLSGAQLAAQSKSEQDTTAALGRLDRTLTSVKAELPASEMSLNLERALYSLKQETGADGLQRASGALLMAINVSIKSTLPTLVPAVAKEIEAVKTQIDQGQTANAVNAINDLIIKVASHSSLKTVTNTIVGVRAAQDALAREAWPVVVAELQQLDVLFGELVKQSQPAVAAAPAAEQKAPPAELKATPAPEQKAAPAAPPSGAATPPTAPPAAGAAPSAPEQQQQQAPSASSQSSAAQSPQRQASAAGSPGVSRETLRSSSRRSH